MIGTTDRETPPQRRVPRWLDFMLNALIGVGAVTVANFIGDNWPF